MLSERELCGCLAELNLDKSKVEQCISKPDSETVQLIYEHLLSLLTGIDKQSLTTPVFAAMEDAQMEFPELHDESIPAVNLFIQVSKLLRTSGVRDFSMRDLAKPDPVRLRKHLSAVINFAKFREEKPAEWEEEMADVIEADARHEAALKRNTELKAMVKEIQDAQKADEESGVDVSEPLKEVEARSIHWSPYDRVRVVNADP